MSHSTRIIINADDLGFSPQVNAAVLCCAELGTVTAASVMVNMPFAEEALSQVQKCVPHLSLALHFTLTSGKPVSPPQDVPLLIDPKGLFRLGFLGLWRSLLSEKKPELLSQIQTELSAQLRLMDQLTEKYQVRFDHIDSHQHVHVLPGIWELVHQASEQRQVPLRVPRERWGNFRRWCCRCWSWFPQGVLKQMILNHCLKNVPQRIGYFGILDSGRMDSSALQAIIQSVGRNPSLEAYEINVHPSALAEWSDGAICCSKGDEQFYASLWRDREFRALNGSDIFQWLRRYNVALTGY